ncbi:DEAD/DEAH box helicase [bacterium]|nr:DEAD/DEAH box helicase [bacterium]
MKFEKYHIAPEIIRNLTLQGFRRPTDIQFKAIPSILNGEDVLAIAQTGTGKTAAFAIPVIHLIHMSKQSKRVNGIQCMVLVPTRELAMQIGDVFHALSKHTRVKAYAVYGGVEQDPQIARLQHGIDILVATPGRMFDLISQGYIDLGQIRTLVLDEADQMLDLGFIDDIRAVKKKISRPHQTLFFSATINRTIKKLAFSQVKQSAIRIQISPEDPVAKNVSHFVMFVQMDDKRYFLENFIRDHEPSKILVFVRTRVRSERVSNAMARAGIETVVIHGQKDQNDRSHSMNAFKSGRHPVLIATDVSARGIDIPDVDYVINYDLPEKPENYVHRVGRTGRGTRKGIAVSFCSPGEKQQLEQIEGFINKKIETIRIGKKSYKNLRTSASDESRLESLLKEFEILEKKQKKKK